MKISKGKGNFFLRFFRGIIEKKGGRNFQKWKRQGKRGREPIYFGGIYRGPTYEDTVTQRSIKNTKFYLTHLLVDFSKFFERFPEGSLDFVFILEILFLCKNTSGCFLPITSSISGKLIMSY